MTLIAGTPVWGGVCLAADTRVTTIYKDGKKPTYKDNALKIIPLGIGLSMTVAGNVNAAKYFKDIFVKKILSLPKDKKTSDGNPLPILGETIKESLQELVFLKIPANECDIYGLIAGVISDTPLILFPDECLNIVNILKSSTFKNKVSQKYLKEFEECASGIKDKVILLEYPYSFLIAFENELATGTRKAKLNVYRIPFGKVAAFGSGKSPDHPIQADNTLSFILFKEEPEDIENMAFHLTRTHAWSDMVVGVNPTYGFRTFGGAIIPAMMIIDDKNPSFIKTQVLEGRIGRKIDGKIVSNVFERAGELWVQTEEGKRWKLKSFLDIKSKKKDVYLLTS